MRIPQHVLRLAVILAVLLPAIAVLAQSGPPIPPTAFLDSYSFLDTNWFSDIGYPPIAFTNLASVQDLGGNALLLDTTNLEPAFLRYRIVETNSATNLDFSTGAILAIVVPDWASADTNQHGFGPGSTGYILAAGDWSSGSPQGFWAIYVDSAGTNIYFGGLSNSIATNWASATISWASNSIHLIGLAYSTNSVFYLDGQLAGSGGPVTIVPSTNAWTNGFNIGSDDLGYEQFRGIFLYMEMDNSNIDSSALVSDWGPAYFTDQWDGLTNAYYNWFNSSGGGDNSMFSPGSLHPLGSSGTCIFSNAVYLTNMSSSVVLGQGVTFTFAIEGGSSNAFYDLFSTTNLEGPEPSNSVWTWLGEGTNCGVYSVTNQPLGQTYYLLGTPLLASDGSGLTVAYERLISSAFTSDGYGTPNAWYLWEGINPESSGVGIADPNGDGLLNWQEYLYGTNPQVSQGFAVWVSQPSGTTGLP
jgi:hypothetical protein